MTKVLVPLAEGVEEMEAVITIDTLRRATWEVTVAGIQEGTILASRGVRLVPDRTWETVRPSAFDVLAIPGGRGGVERLCAHAGVLEAVREMRAMGKWIAAICAGPLVLQEAGILDGRKVTCHPGEKARMTAATRLDEPVVVDGRIVTSQGAGTTFDFALKLIELIDGAAKAREVAEAMVYLR